MHPLTIRDYAIVGLMLGTWAVVGAPSIAAHLICREVCRHGR